jgi:thymidylate kinase
LGRLSWRPRHQGYQEEGPPVLQSLDTNVTVCLERAYRARELANDAVDKKSREFWLAMERKWQDLAQSYEVQQRVDWFMRATPRGGGP